MESQQTIGNTPFDAILAKTVEYQRDIFQFTRDLVRAKGGSGDEALAAACTKMQMEKLGFDKVEVDQMGNVLGYIGTGETLLAMDGHLDVVGVGDASQWDCDPYEGAEDDERIYGRGTTDMKGALACLVYAAKIIKDLDLANHFTLLVAATVAEESCDGLAWKYLIEEQKIYPEFVILAEPSDGKICRAQKGRMEIVVSTQGKSAHGSTPENGENAIYKMAKIVSELEALNARLPIDKLLGQGKLCVSEIRSNSPSRCAVADACSISIDRRLTWGETPNAAMTQIKNLKSVQKAKAKVEPYVYDTPSYTGFEYGQTCVFKSWKIETDHPLTQSVVSAYQGLFCKQPTIDVWPFSTNGVAIMGLHKIPVIGYGPGELHLAHVANESVKKKELIECTALYAAIPTIYMQRKLQQ